MHPVRTIRHYHRNGRPWKVLLVGCGSVPLLARSALDLAHSRVPATLHKALALETNIVYSPDVVLNKRTGDMKAFEIKHQPLVMDDDMIVYDGAKWAQNL